MKKLIVGNWKMNMDREGVRKLAVDLLADVAANDPADYLVCPPHVHLHLAAELFEGSVISVGAQDCAAQDDGAYTGDVSAAMLRDAGCSYVILGHSERRQYHGETDEIISKKAAKAQENGLITIICVGETEGQRTEGQEEAVVGKQLQKVLPASANAENTVIAYEPVWAIGTGKTASPADVEAMHGFIRRKLGEKLKDAKSMRILYGGSMKAANAKELLAVANVDGGLIGGASLKAAEFIAIAKSA